MTESEEPVFNPGWDAWQAMNEQIVSYIKVEALLSCLFEQNLLVMERLEMGEFEALRKEWEDNYESTQARIIMRILKKYPAKS